MRNAATPATQLLPTITSGFLVHNNDDNNDTDAVRCSADETENVGSYGARWPSVRRAVLIYTRSLARSVAWSAICISDHVSSELHVTAHYN